MLSTILKSFFVTLAYALFSNVAYTQKEREGDTFCEFFVGDKIFTIGRTKNKMKSTEVKELLQQTKTITIMQWI